MRSDCSEPPKSTLHGRLKEHKDGLDGVTTHPECENRWHSRMYPRDDRWWRCQDPVDKVGATQMPHAHRNGALW
jgi:hypothetical protein